MVIDRLTWPAPSSLVRRALMLAVALFFVLLALGPAPTAAATTGAQPAYDLAVRDAGARFPTATANAFSAAGPRSAPTIRDDHLLVHAAVATEAAGEAFHHTGSQNVASIEADGLRAGSYATPSGELSPLQAQIDLALPPNRGLPEATLRIGVAGLREAGYDIPEVTQVGRSHNMPGGGYEVQFPYAIPPEFIKVVP